MKNWLRCGLRLPLAGAGLLAACLLAVPPARAAEPLTFWTFLATQGSDPRSAALREVVDGFNHSQSAYKVSVESINFARYDNVVIEATAAGQGPDVLNVYTDQLPMHVAAGTVRPLDSLLDASWAEEAKDFAVSPDFLRFGGKLMAVPWEARVWLLWYRRDELAAAGLPVPKTLAELQTDAVKLTNDKTMGFGFGASTGALGSGAIEAFVPIFWGAGGKLFDANGKTLINSAAGVKTLTWLRDMVAANAMKKTVVGMSVEDALASVKAGTISMTVMGSYRVGAARAAEATGNNLLTAPVPGWTAASPSPARVASQTLAIGADCKHPDGAWAFIQYYISPAAQLAFARAGVMPSRLSTYKLAGFDQLPNAAELRQWAGYLHDHGHMEATPKDFSVLSEALATAIQRTIMQGVAPKAAIDEAARAYNSRQN